VTVLGSLARGQRRRMVARLPLNLSKTIRALKEVSANANEPASLVLAGEPALVERAKEQFAAGGTVPAARAEGLNGLQGISPAPGEVVVALVTLAQEAEAEALLGGPVRRGSVILAVDEGFYAPIRASYLGSGVVRLSFSDSIAGWERLFGLCAEAAGPKAVSLGRRYPVLRRAVARRLISRTAAQNGLIALVFFVPGSDMPVMTLNQAKMVLHLAALYGERLDTERATELIGVLVLGFGFRGIARRLARSLPDLVPFLRIATAYSATLAVGWGAMAYFEKGAPASTSKVVALAQSARD
jgi:uncharacterized protein (DUF697 family)